MPEDLALALLPAAVAVVEWVAVAVLVAANMGIVMLTVGRLLATEMRVAAAVAAAAAAAWSGLGVGFWRSGAASVPGACLASTAGLLSTLACIEIGVAMLVEGGSMLDIAKRALGAALLDALGHLAAGLATARGAVAPLEVRWDPFRVSQARIKLRPPQGPYASFTVASAPTERARRAAAWLYRGNEAPDWDDWCQCAARFGLGAPPPHCLLFHLAEEHGTTAPPVPVLVRFGPEAGRRWVSLALGGRWVLGSASASLRLGGGAPGRLAQDGLAIGALGAPRGPDAPAADAAADQAPR